MISILVSSTRRPSRNINQTSNQAGNRPASQNVNRPSSRNTNPTSYQPVNRTRNENVNRPINENVSSRSKLPRPKSQNVIQSFNQLAKPNVNRSSKRRSCNIAHLFDWQLRVGKWLITVDRFLLCIPLKPGSYITAIITLANSILSFGLVTHIIVYYRNYLEVYERKMDVFMYLIIYLTSSIHFMVTSIFLIIGTCRKKPTLIKVYLWGVVIHVLVNILNSLLFSIYCIIYNDCFQGAGWGQLVINFVCMFFFFIIWLYLASVINSILILQQREGRNQRSNQLVNRLSSPNRNINRTLNRPRNRPAKPNMNRTSNRPANRSQSPNVNRSLNQPKNYSRRQNVKETSNRPTNRPSNQNANRTLNKPTNRPSSPNSNKPMNRSPKWNSRIKIWTIIENIMYWAG